MTDQKILAKHAFRHKGVINPYKRFLPAYLQRWIDAFRENGISRQYYTRLVCHIMRDYIWKKITIPDEA
jgi:hypothetical protein